MHLHAPAGKPFGHTLATHLARALPTHQVGLESKAGADRAVVRTSHPPLPHFRLEKRGWPGYTYAMADAPPPGNPSSAPSSGAPRSDWPKATLWMVVFGLIGLNIAFFIHSCRSLPGDALDRTGRVIQKAGQALSDVATAFKQGGKVKMEFMSYATSISNHQHFHRY